MADINLIPQEERSTERIENAQKKLQFVSIGFLVVTAIVTVITLSLFAAASSRRSNLVAEVEDASSKINRYKAQEELVVVAKDKASTADQLVGGRVDFNKVFSVFSSLVPQGVYFTDIRVNAGKLVLSGKARTSADVAGLANSLTSPSGAQVVSDVAVDSLSSDENGVYSFVASAKIVGAVVPGSVVPAGGAGVGTAQPGTTGSGAGTGSGQGDTLQ